MTSEKIFLLFGALILVVVLFRSLSHSRLKLKVGDRLESKVHHTLIEVDYVSKDGKHVKCTMLKDKFGYDLDAHDRVFNKIEADINYIDHYFKLKSQSK